MRNGVHGDPPESTLEPLARHPIWMQAYEVLRARILSGELAPGTHLNLRHIATQLGISVTPTRDAALRLASEGLVEESGNRGLRITQLTEQDVVSAFQLRILLETHAVRQGGPRMTARHFAVLDELLSLEEAVVRAEGPPDLARYALVSRRFHHALVAAAEDRMLMNLYDRLHAYVVIERAQRGFFLDRVEEDHQEHLTIVTAMRRGEHERAATLLGEHLEHVRSFTFSLYRRMTSDGAATR